MITDFYSKNKPLIIFFGFSVTVTSLFLNITKPENQLAKEALDSINFSFLTITSILLILILLKFYIKIISNKLIFEKIGSTFVSFIYASIFYAWAVWTLHNLWEFINYSFQEPFNLLVIRITASLIFPLSISFTFLIMLILMKFFKNYLNKKLFLLDVILIPFFIYVAGFFYNLLTIIYSGFLTNYPKFPLASISNKLISIDNFMIWNNLHIPIWVVIFVFVIAFYYVQKPKQN